MPGSPFCTTLAGPGAPSFSVPLRREDDRMGGRHRPGAAGQLTPLLPPAGLESVDHYPILVAVTGILVRLLVHGPASG